MKDKVQAIYEVRDAAEEHARAELNLEILQTPEARERLLDAKIRLENNTHDAIVACQHCGRPHSGDGDCNIIPFPSASPRHD